MNSAEEQMLKHTSDLFDRVLGPAREGNMTQSFDAIHNAALEPPETRPCEPGEHTIDDRTLEVESADHITVRCEFCDAIVGFKMDSEGWKL